MYYFDMCHPHVCYTNNISQCMGPKVGPISHEPITEEMGCGGHIKTSFSPSNYIATYVDH